jgi:hypothetical protein
MRNQIPFWHVRAFDELTEGDWIAIGLGVMPTYCVWICVRKSFQNLLKFEKIGKSVENL